MKRAVSFRATRVWSWAVLGTLAGVTASEAVPWVERREMAGSAFQTEFDRWTAEPYRLRLTRLTGSEEGGSPRYTAIFEKNERTEDWAARHGLSAVDFTAAHDALHAQGFRLVWLDGFGAGTMARYNGIWERNGGAVQRLQLGESLTRHEAANSANRAAGFNLVDVSSFSVGGTPLHAGLWAEGPVVATEVRYLRSGSQYQSDFDQMAAQGYRLWRVGGYESGLLERFTGVWKRSGAGEGWSYHGMSAAAFAAHDLNAQHLGYRPVCIDPYHAGGHLKYNATWVRNGGFSTARLSQLDAFVRTYMENRNLPGLSLAIMREGRLVLARGYGFADTASSTLADPVHRWRFASVSKPVCAVSVLRALEGTPDWNLDSRVFGSGAFFGTDYGTASYNQRERTITIRHLLNMTAGWDSQGKLWYFDEPSWGENHRLIIGYQLDSVNPARDPGTLYSYNNFNYQVAARIPEKLTGTLFENYTRDQVFLPCGITSMAMGGRTAADRLVHEVTYYAGDMGGNPEIVHPARMDGSTAWIGKPSDLLLLARRIDGTSRHRDIIHSSSLAAMRLANGQPDSDGDISNYGLGWYPSSRHGLTWWQHNGGMPGSQAILCISQDGSQGLAYATNSVHSSDGSSALFRNGVQDWMDAVENVDDWPIIDLFGTYNPGYDTWATTAFGSMVTSQLGLVEIWAPGADPDGDERPNAMEAYLGSDPLEADRTNWVNVLLTDTHLILRWTRVRGYRGVEASAEWSVAAEVWNNANAEIITREDIFVLPPRVTEEARIPRASLSGFGRDPVKFGRLVFAVP